MGKILQLPRNLKPRSPEGEEVFVPMEKLLRMIYKHIPSKGGPCRIAFLAERLNFPGFSLRAKENLVRRALAWSLEIKKGKPVPMFIGVLVRSGTITQPLPTRIEPVGDEVRFE